MVSRENVLERVARVLAEALNIDQTEELIVGSSCIMEDLGAESVDFLDIVFRLEREFGIKIRRREIFPELLFSDQESKSVVRSWTVDFIVNYIHGRLNNLEHPNTSKPDIIL